MKHYSTVQIVMEQWNEGHAMARGENMKHKHEDLFMTIGG